VSLAAFRRDSDEARGSPASMMEEMPNGGGVAPW
jgi:hypothetical protein